jgi:hypothetical protein
MAMISSFEWTDGDRELFVLFVLGMLLGFVGIAILEAWVVAADQADRRRIREVLAEWFAEIPLQDRQESVLAIASQSAIQPSEKAGGTIVCQ